MKKVKLGNQVPTQSFILPYKKTLGSAAIKLYNSTGRKAQKWQELMLSDIMATNREKLWVHAKFGYEVPRRNGKNEIIAIREMWGLVNGENILHTAHRTTTTHVAWERLYDLLVKANIKIKSIYRAYGKEHITLDNCGKIEFRTRTSKGGLGEGYDLLVIDEAQEYQDDQESALKYVVSDSKNPQTIFCGTPPTATSTGTIFTNMRNDCLCGNTTYTGWAEWSIDKQSDPHDRDLWYLTNPSLGTILSERKIESEISTDVIDFNIQRLGLWFKYNLKSAISEVEWDSLKLTELPKLRGKLFVGIKYGKDGSNVAMSLAVKTFSNKIFVESIDCRPIRAGNDWIINFLSKVCFAQVVVDGANGQSILKDQMENARLKEPILPTVKEIIVANAVFEQAISAKTIAHLGQPSLARSVTNCEKRSIGSNGGFGYKSIKDDSDIALMDSVILAYWSASVAKEEIKQRIMY